MPLTLQHGSRGPAVQDLQGNLRAAGFEVKPDGRFGPDTHNAVRSFQRSRSLKDDGIVGPDSWKALHHSEPASPNFDPFDPADYASWLSERADRAGTYLHGLFGSGGGPTASSSPPRSTSPSPPRTGKVSGSAKPTNYAPPPPQVSPSQNRQHGRIAFAGFAGRGYVLRDFDRFRGWEVQLVGRRIVRKFEGGIRNECAQFVQMFGVPRTTFWRAGPQVCHMMPGQIPVGTVVATLRDGIYHNDYSGRSHVGIYLGHDPYDPAKGNANAGGIHLLDQFNGRMIDRRTKMYSRRGDLPGRVAKKPWIDGAGRRQTRRVDWSNDGEEYYVLMSAQ